MYVAKVKLENIRGFHDARKVDLDLSRPDGSFAGWTVVTGPSGSGRTTFLQAIALALTGPNAGNLTSLTGWISSGKERGGIEVDLVPTADDSFVRGFEPPAEEYIFADLALTGDGFSTESNVGRNGPWQDNPSGWLCVGYGPFRRPGGTRPQPRLAGLFRPDVLMLNGDAGGDGERGLSALIADLTKQTQDCATGVVLIDEIEAHLDLSWQQRVAGRLRERFPGIQFIVSTNSPYVCQAADPGGLIALGGQPRIIEGDLYDRVVHGSGEDVALSELFGLDSPYSASAQRLRHELVELEIKVLEGRANEIQTARYRELQELLVSSPTARAVEIAARLQKDKARRG